MKNRIVVHRNPASPFPMYFYALDEHNYPEIEAFPGHPGLWYGLYVLPDFLAIQVPSGWQYFYPLVTKNGRRFVVDLGLPMYVSLNEQNVVETFKVSAIDRKSIPRQTISLLLGDDRTHRPTTEERAFVNHPEYLAAFKLTKRAQGLDYR